MAQYRLETLEGGISTIIVTGTVDEDHDLFQALSHLSKSQKHILVNLLEMTLGSAKFFSFLNDLSARTKMKVITHDKTTMENCQNIHLPTYPTIKSAALSYAGDETISMMLSRLRDVPILNSEAYELYVYMGTPEATFEKLEVKVKDKPGLCSQIFRTANSAFFKRVKKAETLSQALVLLGMSNLRQMFVFNFYNGVGNTFRAQQTVIDHGRKCAALAEFIAKAAGASNEECQKVRLGGLLHDIGRQALAFFFPQQYERVQKIIETDRRSSYMAELLVFGTEHQTVGSILSARWNFPSYLSNVIGDHHYLAATDWNTLTLPIFCANEYLNERENMPFQQYYQRLEGYFLLKRKDLPWEDTPAAFDAFLQDFQDPFVA